MTGRDEVSAEPVATLVPSRHGRNRVHHLTPSVAITLVSTRTVRVGRTLCGLPMGPQKIAASVCAECKEIAMNHGSFDPHQHEGLGQRPRGDEVPGFVMDAWREWQDQARGNRFAILALDCWPKEAQVFREELSKRDTPLLVWPAGSIAPRGSKQRTKLLNRLKQWGVLVTLQPTEHLRSKTWRIVAGFPVDAKIPPRDPRVVPWPGDVLTRGTRSRLVVSLPVDDVRVGKPTMVRYRDHHGREATTGLASWGQWASKAEVADSAPYRVERLVAPADVADSEALSSERLK